MITSKCKQHPGYEGKREPKTCPACWAIYNKVHGIVTGPRAAQQEEK